MSRGRKPGTPKTGGRVKGSQNEKPPARQIRIEAAAAKLEDVIPNCFIGDAHMLLMSVYKDLDQPFAIRLDAAKSAIRYEVPALATVEQKQDPDQFAKEQALKAKSLDIQEVARRIAFIFAEAQRKAPPPEAVQPALTH